ncbi:phosphoribosyltransferase-like protein [Truncatella angustata]|uniref:adenine phosphoribosyltransferase n=1 Tax=Truncatella angustata TaxID=152316 RepID=A0A9P8UTE5_9PEZI|nr:phosphoribosyltransferase-like protein [Truncatella angustata]KAH6657841.1 phosphoribosyltransferase-like protein [Truncatella angustata]
MPRDESPPPPPPVPPNSPRVLAALRNFPDFPIPGIDFIDILPIFQDPQTFEALLQVLTNEISETLGFTPDVIVGLDARGFLFGPTLALRLGCSFVAVRKKGKVPGPTVTAAYEKEYGTDYFQMQSDAIKPGQKVLVVDDIIATGGSAAAAGALVTQLGGTTVGYLFLIEIPFLKGRDKLGNLPIIKLLDAA